MSPEETPGGSQSAGRDRSGSAMETLAILTLAIYGMLGVQTFRVIPASEAPPDNREVVVHMSAIPLTFEMTAVLGARHPLVLTISSKPERNLRFTRAPQRRQE
jgi:hypothetical protein